MVRRNVGSGSVGVTEGKALTGWARGKPSPGLIPSRGWALRGPSPGLISPGALTGVDFWAAGAGGGIGGEWDYWMG